MLPWLLFVAALAFAIGLIASPWFERSVRGVLPAALRSDNVVGGGAGVARVAALERALNGVALRVAALEARPAAVATPGDAPALAAPTIPDAAAGERLARLEGRTEAIGGAQLALDARVADVQVDIAGLSARIDQTGRRAEESLSAALAGAERAEAVLLVAAARRAIEDGRALGPLEAALRTEFGTSPAVEAVAALGRAPVSLQTLRRDFARLRPTIRAGSGASPAGWWPSLKANLGSIVSVRRSGTGVAADPAAVLDGAQRALDGGDVAGALAQLARLPADARGRAAGWIGAARRHVDGARALAAIEARALTPAAPTPPVTPAPMLGAPGASPPSAPTPATPITTL